MATVAASLSGLLAVPAAAGAWSVTAPASVPAPPAVPAVESTPAAAVHAVSGPQAGVAAPVVGVASSSGGGGWEALADGSVIAIGGAPSLGSLVGTHLARPVVGIAATPSGHGYWLVASDGGVFSFGDAGFFGSAGRLRLVRPIVGMAATPSGHGYWLVASDGGVFSFGDAPFLGSLAGQGYTVPSVSPGPAGQGYLMVTSGGLAVPYSPGSVTNGQPLANVGVATDASTPTNGATAGSVGAQRGTLPGSPSPTAAPAAAAPTPTLPEHNMHLVFDDEFNGPSLSSTWDTCWWYAPTSDGCSNGTGEGEWYTPNNVSVHDGMLSLTARDQPTVGVNQNTGAPRTYSWTSGMVDSHGKFSFTYGYVEWKAQVPAGMGLWPALWLMPESGAWPPEIDVLEMVGSQPNVWTGSYHEPSGASQGHDQTIAGLYSGWHTFGADWEPGRITWYVDGRAVATSTSNVTNTAMYLVMDLAVGGAWPGYPNADTPFPSSLNIDYVRVWQQ